MRFFSGPRLGAVERCVWEQAAWSEWATAEGRAVATILCDLLKAFDCVAHPKLIDAEVSRCGNSDCQCSCTKEPLHHTRVRFRYHPSPAAAGGCR